MKVSKVKLRRQKNRKGNQYYYRLDIYPPVKNMVTGKEVRFVTTGIWIWVKPVGEAQKEYNKETLAKLKAYQSKYQLDVQNKALDFLDDYNQNKDFLEYFLELANQRKNSLSNYNKWMIVYAYLKDFSSSIKVKDLSLEFSENFKQYLLNRVHKRKKNETISVNSASSYFSKFVYALKQAYKFGFIKDNIAVRIDRIRNEDTKKEFLTKDEVLKLSNTPCKDKVLKKICLFMIYSGQRVSDVEDLKWKDIEYSNESGYYIRFAHKKTKNQQTLTISDEAIDLLGEPKEKEDLIFEGFKRDYRSLEQWGKDAEINKKLGFHIFRHTSATLLLSHGVDIYQVKERLGHSNIKNTMLYVNLLNKQKIEAANAFSLKIKSDE